MTSRQLHYLFVKSELGAGTWGASLGIEALYMAAHRRGNTIFEKHPYTWIEDESIKRGDRRFAKNIKPLLSVYERIVESIKELDASGHFPFIVSGDHSNAGGTIAGLKLAKPDERLGVIWIDAHADLHSPFTTPSGNVHGMPLASALNLRKEHALKPNPVGSETEQCWADMCELGGIAPKIQAQDIVFIGIRDLEAPEWRIIDEQKVPYFTPQDVHSEGARAIGQEALAKLSNCDRIYVSFDVDSVDSAIYSGTGTPVPGGISSVQAIELLQQFWASEKLCAVETTEINPLLDQGNKTAETVLHILMRSMLDR